MSISTNSSKWVGSIGSAMIVVGSTMMIMNGSDPGNITGLVALGSTAAGLFSSLLAIFTRRH